MAADKHHKSQQFGDRCPAVARAALQSQPAALQVIVAAHSPSDRHYSGKRNCGAEPASAIQVATTSNSNDQQYHHRHASSLIGDSRRVGIAILDENNNNGAAVQLPRANLPTINHCHHEAATRTLLFHHHHRLGHHHATTTTTASDSSQTTADTSLRTDASSSGSDENQDQSPTPPPNYHEIPGIVPAYQGRSSGPPPSYDDVVNPNAPPPSYQSLFGQVREARKTSNGLVDLLRQLFLILIGTLGCTMIIGFLLLIPITMILVGVVYVNECRAENIPTFLVVGGIVWIMKNILNCYNQFKKDSTTSNRPPPRRSPISSSSTTTSSARLAAGDSPASVLIVGHQQQSHTNDNQPQSHDPSTPTSAPTPTTTTTSATTARTSATVRTRRELEPSANRIRTPSLIGITSFKCESMLNYFLIVWFFAGCIVVYRIYEPDYDNPLSQSYCHRTVYLYAFWLITSAFIIMAIVLSCLCCLMASSLMNCNHGR